MTTLNSVNHTPGPWVIDRPKDDIPTINSPLGEPICDVYEHGSPGGAYNIALIAAAPDLLAALILLHDNLAEYQRINNIGGYENHDMKMARAAIDKALA